jgi:hypothetical protein
MMEVALEAGAISESEYLKFKEENKVEEAAADETN